MHGIGRRCIKATLELGGFLPGSMSRAPALRRITNLGCGEDSTSIPKEKRRHTEWSVG